MEQINSAVQEQPEEITPKIEELENKKKKFLKNLKRIRNFSILFVLVIIVISSIITYYNNNRKTYVTEPDPETPKVIEVVDEDIVPTKTHKEYTNDEHGLYVKYDSADSLIIGSESSQNYLFKIKSQDILPEQNPTGENLQKGYMLLVTPLEFSVRTLEEVTEIKKENFNLSCLDTAEISKTIDVIVDGFEAKQFNVVNCNSDYVVTYVQVGGFIYEIIRIYKGDVGFIQVYRNKVAEIYNSIDFLINNNIVVSPNEIYENKNDKYMFTYSKELDTTCCNVAEPPVGQIQKNIVLAEQNNENAVGFFVNRNDDRLSLEQYVDLTITTLVDDYKVIKSTEPNGEKTELEIDGRKAYLLKDYSWKNNDLILVMLGNDRSILVISKTEISEQFYNQIIESLKIL